jgi:hypothetical protein
VVPPRHPSMPSEPIRDRNGVRLVALIPNDLDGIQEHCVTLHDFGGSQGTFEIVLATLAGAASDR